MSESLGLLAAAALDLLGMAWLALSMEVHWGQVMHRPAAKAVSTRKVLRVLGAVALSFSLLTCLMVDRPSMAALVWVLLLAASATAVAMLLASRPRVLRLVWPIGT